MFYNKISIAIYDDIKKIDEPVDIVELTVNTQGWVVSNDNTLDYAIYLTKKGAKLESSTYMLVYPLCGSEDALVSNVKIISDGDGRMHLCVGNSKANIKLSNPSRNKAMRLFANDKIAFQDGFQAALKSAVVWIKQYQS